MEYARQVLGITDAQHAEYGDTHAPLVVMPLSCSLVGQTLEVVVQPDSRTGHIYQQRRVREQYHCNFGLNGAYQTLLHEGGLRIVGADTAGEARIVELPASRFFVGTLFLPQHLSTVARPHPLIVAYVAAAAEFRDSRAPAAAPGRDTSAPDVTRSKAAPPLPGAPPSDPPR